MSMHAILDGHAPGRSLINMLADYQPCWLSRKRLEMGRLLPVRFETPKKGKLTLGRATISVCSRRQKRPFPGPKQGVIRLPTFSESLLRWNYRSWRLSRPATVHSLIAFPTKEMTSFESVTASCRIGRGNLELLSRNYK